MDAGNSRRSSSAARYWGAVLLFLVAAGFLAWTEHRAHVFGSLPYLIVLLCPLIHLFGHRGHNH
jgi:hypothetical protein